MTGARIAALAVALASPLALAHSGGIAGVSGLGGTTCNRCHSGGPSPTATLEGPATLVAGSTGRYTLTVRGGAAVVGGANIAVDDPHALLTPVSPTLVSVGDTQLMHEAPVPFDGDTLVFQFDLAAPPAGGAVSIYAAGNSCNWDHASTGDRSASAVLQVAIAPAAADGGAAADLAEGDPPPPVGCTLVGPRVRATPALLVPFALLLAARTGRRRLIRRRRWPARSASPRR